jgi:hypothetical protein
LVDYAVRLGYRTVYQRDKQTVFFRISEECSVVLLDLNAFDIVVNKALSYCYSSKRLHKAYKNAIDKEIVRVNNVLIRNGTGLMLILYFLREFKNDGALSRLVLLLWP